VPVKETVADTVVECRDEPISAAYFYDSFYFLSRNQAQCHGRDDAKQTIASDSEAEEFRGLLAAAWYKVAIRIHQSERLNVADERHHGQAPSVSVRRQCAADA